MIEGEYPRPLGAFERAMVRTQRHSAFNVVVVLRFTRGPHAEAVAAALAALTARHALLRCRVDRHAGRESFVHGAPPIALDRLAWRGEEGWSELAEEALARPFDLASGPFAHALLAGPESDGRADLVLTFPHLAIDAASGSALWRSSWR